MTINANTKIAAILKHNADALEAIISISPKFSKLRNPLLRKLMASRTSIGTASKIGGCTVSDFYNKLKPLGFTIDTETKEEKTLPKQAKPDFMLKLTTDNTTELDVRPILETGKDPLSIIVEKTNELPKEHTLKLINSFEPTPLIQLLEKKGYIAYSETVSENLIYTYFYKSLNVKEAKSGEKPTGEDWDSLINKFLGKTKIIDVRELEMPQPMLTILENLDTLIVGNALYVYHKRIPVFLLPELKERGFEYRAKELSDSEVHLLIFKE